MRITQLKIVKHAFSSINDITSYKSSIEQVGLLFGVTSNSKVLIEYFVEMENVDSSPQSFSIDYERLIHYIGDYQEKEKALVGFFHTHPVDQKPLPSKTDEYYMKLWPSPYIWLIGIYPNIVLAFSYYNDEIVEISYKII